MNNKGFFIWVIHLNVGLRQGCVMSPWLFNVYMDGVAGEVNVKVLGKGLELLNADGSKFKITSCYLQMIQHLWLAQSRSV